MQKTSGGEWAALRRARVSEAKLALEIIIAHGDMAAGQQRNRIVALQRAALAAAPSEMTAEKLVAGPRDASTPRPWSIEVLGFQMRIVGGDVLRDGKDEYQDDVIGLGDVRDERVRADCELIVAALRKAGLMEKKKLATKKVRR